MAFSKSLCVGAFLTVGRSMRIADESVTSPSQGSVEPDSSTTNDLVQWFKDNKLPSADAEKMDGDVNDGKWAYMDHECFKRRYKTVSKLILERKCKTVVEVGGYLTPLDSFLLEEHKNSGGSLPETYMNVDPSMKNAEASKNEGMRSLQLPLSLADLFSKEAKSLREKFTINVDPNDTCAIAFGIWDPHYKEKQDQAAMGRLFKSVRFLGVETSDYATKWLKATDAVAQKMGLTLLRSEDNDCREEMKDSGKEDTTLLRHMKFYEKNDESSDSSGSSDGDSSGGSSSGASGSSDSEHSDEKEDDHSEADEDDQSSEGDEHEASHEAHHSSRSEAHSSKKKKKSSH
eukprot:TRINITY_DN120968_c0_g1_i1.p1 TRINITY_DN120968_c0_g1~~TRINITY_DN120968_c0_g1_i1.p1  ORF type:complete len:373 (+),score=95.93 TRINITY_DN120968_c0_g1_i1:86-1120(+)